MGRRTEPTAELLDRDVDVSLRLVRPGVNVVAASPSGDQPGARVEDHAAPFDVVRGEHLAQALDGAGRLVVAQVREGRARVLKPPDERERGVEVVSVEDRLVDVLEAYAGEAGALEDARGGLGLAQREGSAPGGGG